MPTQEAQPAQLPALRSLARLRELAEAGGDPVLDAAIARVVDEAEAGKPPTSWFNSAI